MGDLIWATIGIGIVIGIGIATAWQIVLATDRVAGAIARWLRGPAANAKRRPRGRDDIVPGPDADDRPPVPPARDGIYR